MTGVLVADCRGVWRRTLLVEADGSRDTAPGVLWVQGLTAYVDSRGFAGTLVQSGSVFEWRRAVDLEPPGRFPDAGEMRWQEGTLVETGVHADYVEHWVRDGDAPEPCGALFLLGPGGEPGLLVRVGAWFGFAGRGAVVLDEVGGARWRAVTVDGEGVLVDDVVVDDVRWTVQHSEGDVTP